MGLCMILSHSFPLYLPLYLSFSLYFSLSHSSYLCLLSLPLLNSHGFSVFCFSQSNFNFLSYICVFCSLFSIVTVISPGEEVQSRLGQPHLVLIPAQHGTSISGEQALCTQVCTRVSQNPSIPEYFKMMTVNIPLQNEQ